MKSCGKSIRLKRQSHNATLAATLARVTEMVDAVTPEEAAKYCCPSRALLGGDPSGLAEMARSFGFPETEMACPFCNKTAPTPTEPVL